MAEVNKGIRLLNYVIDLLVITICLGIVVVIHGSEQPWVELLIPIYLIYCFIMESVFGQTVGKMITRTKVVDLSEQKPKPLRILLRTILRLYPADAVSYAFIKELGAHDVLSKTRLRHVRSSNINVDQ